jgi:hypothetical protein
MSAEAVGSTISDNFLLLFFSIILFIIFIMVLRVINSWLSIKKARTVAEFEIDLAKLEIAKKKAVMDELRNSSVVLNDREREKLEKIRTDSSILSRKLIFDMNEMEERTRRLELGTDSFNVKNMLLDVKGYERRLFGKKK